MQNFRDRDVATLFQAASSWLYVYPKGIRDLLVYTKKTYNNPIIYITENGTDYYITTLLTYNLLHQFKLFSFFLFGGVLGVDETNDENLSLEESLKDDFRIKFYQQHLSYVQSAIR